MRTTKTYQFHHQHIQVANFTYTQAQIRPCHLISYLYTYICYECWSRLRYSQTSIAIFIFRKSALCGVLAQMLRRCQGRGILKPLYAKPTVFCLRGSTLCALFINPPLSRAWMDLLLLCKANMTPVAQRDRQSGTMALWLVTYDLKYNVSRPLDYCFAVRQGLWVRKTRKGSSQWSDRMFW